MIWQRMAAERAASRLHSTTHPTGPHHLHTLQSHDPSALEPTEADVHHSQDEESDDSEAEHAFEVDDDDIDDEEDLPAGNASGSEDEDD